MGSRRFIKYMFSEGGFLSSGTPPSVLTLYNAQDKEQDFWRDPISDSMFGGKTTINISLVDEEIDEKDFYAPKKQGEVDVKRGKPNRPDSVLKLKDDKVVQVAPEESTKRIARVLQLDGTLSHELPENQPDPIRKITNLGFASMMSQPFMPALNLSHFDALEYRIRVLDSRTWIANIACKGDHDGEMFQALFTGSEKWSSVIIPFKKYLFTSRGVLAEQQQDLDSNRISTLGFLQAERTEGDFKIQLESIRAISMARLSAEIRYDPNAFTSDNTEEQDFEKHFIKKSSNTPYYTGVFKY